MECAKYSSLNSKGSSVMLYLDESERKEILGQSHYGVCDWLLQLFVLSFWLISLPVTWCFSFKIIPQSERVVVFRLGRVRSLKGPGLVFIIPFVDSWKRVDMRMRAFKVPPQEVITVDHALVKLGADVQYRVVDPIASYTLIQDLNQSLRLSAHSVMTTQLGQVNFADLENNKISLQHGLLKHMNQAVSEWGIEIGRFELSSHVILKKPGGIDPNVCDVDDDVNGMTAIMNLIKSFTSGSSMQIPGMLPQVLPGNQFSPDQLNNPLSVKPDISTVKPNSSPLMKPDELFSLAKGAIDEELCHQVKSIFEFHVNDGRGVNIWSLDLKNSPGFVLNEAYKRGVVDVKLSLNESNFQKIFYGLMSPTDAYMQGGLKVDGSLQAAKKIELLIRKMQKVST